MEEIKNILQLPLFAIGLTLSVYILSLWLYRKTRIALLHPVLLSVALIIFILSVLKINYETYNNGISVLNLLLDLCVVALGYILYEQIGHIKRHAISILTSVFVGSLVGIGSVLAILNFMDTPLIIQLSVAPKSVTTPIAIRITEITGGIPSLTAIVVIAVGIFGSISGPFILKTMKIHSKIAKGLAMGTSAHGIGTARAIELGAIEGAISGLAIGLMGVFTAILIPIIYWIFY